MMSQSRRTPSFSLLGLMAAGILVGLLSPASAEKPHAANPAVPTDGTRRIELEEQWRLTSDSEDIMIGVIVAAISGPEGDTYLLDRQLCQIYVISPDGICSRVISREGEGPGEVISPVGLAWMPGGNLGIIDSKPGAVTIVDRAGLPKPMLHLINDAGEPDRQLNLSRLVYRGDVIALTADVWDFSSGEVDHKRILATYRQDGTPIKRLLEGRAGSDFEQHTYDEAKDYFVTRNRWAIGSDGSVFLAAQRNRYVIDVLAAEGSPLRSFGRTYEPRKRTGDELSAMRDDRRMWVQGQEVAVESDLEKHDPCINSVHLDAEGWLWVEHGHSRHELPTGVAIRYDLFDPDGRYRQVVELQGEDVDLDRDRLIRLDDGRFVLVRHYSGALSTMYGIGREEDNLDEVEPLEVVCFTITK